MSAYYPVDPRSIRRFTLPYPPSVNTYWRNVKGRMIISKAGREYRKAVCELIGKVDSWGEGVTIDICTYAPDRRRRDLDNVPKAIFDSLTAAGVWEDDSQVHVMRVIRGEVNKPGKVYVSISKIINANRDKNAE